MLFPMLSRVVLLVLVVAFSSSAAPMPDGQWISLKTSHFEMYTTNSEDQARSTLEVLEGVRSFFLQTTSLIQADEKPVRIIAFRSREEYAPFCLQSTSFAHYLHSRRGDYIVLQDISPEHHRAAIHEYTHYVFRMAQLKLPIWLCEGTADFYSSLEAQGTQSVLGGVLPSRLHSLQAAELLPLPTLFAVDHASPFYNEPAKVALFYAQSWAVVHMLAFHPNYRALFPRYLQAVSAGASSSDALGQVYGKSLEDVTLDLQSYIPQIPAHQSATEIRPVQHEEPSVLALSEVEGAITMADLLAAHRSTAREAKNRLEQLYGRHPDNPKAEELLAYLAAQEPETRVSR